MTTIDAVTKHLLLGLLTKPGTLVCLVRCIERSEMLQRLPSSTPRALVPSSPALCRVPPSRHSPASAPSSSTTTAFSRFYEAVQVISVRSPSGDSEEAADQQGRRLTCAGASSSGSSERAPLDAARGGLQKEQPRLVRIRLSVEYRVRLPALAQDLLHQTSPSNRATYRAPLGQWPECRTSAALLTWRACGRCTAGNCCALAARRSLSAGPFST